MKKTFTFVAIIFICFVSVAQNPKQFNQSTNSKYDDITLKHLENKIDSLKSSINQLQQERNYFQTALNSQTVIFSSVLAFVFFIVGILSFVLFKFEITKSEKRVKIIVEEHKNDFKVLEGDVAEQSNLVNLALANVYAAAANIVVKSEDKFIFYISASYFHCKSRHGQTPAESCMKNANIHFDKIMTNDTDKEHFRHIELDKTEKSLKSMVAEKNTMIANTSIDILNKILKFKHEINGVRNHLS